MWARKPPFPRGRGSCTHRCPRSRARLRASAGESTTGRGRRLTGPQGAPGRQHGAVGRQPLDARVVRIGDKELPRGGVRGNAAGCGKLAQRLAGAAQGRVPLRGVARGEQRGWLFGWRPVAARVGGWTCPGSAGKLQVTRTARRACCQAAQPGAAPDALHKNCKDPTPPRSSHPSCCPLLLLAWYSRTCSRALPRRPWPVAALPPSERAPWQGVAGQARAAGAAHVWAAGGCSSVSRG